MNIFNTLAINIEVNVPSCSFPDLDSPQYPIIIAILLYNNCSYKILHTPKDVPTYNDLTSDDSKNITFIHCSSEHELIKTLINELATPNLDAIIGQTLDMDLKYIFNRANLYNIKKPNLSNVTLFSSKDGEPIVIPAP